MNVNKLRAQLEIDEGIVHKIYLDHLGYPTFGIGHLIVEGDPEESMGVGYPVSEDRIIEVFEKDVQTVLNDCEICFEGWDNYPEEVKQVFANMMFNMGRTRLSKFKNMIKRFESKFMKRKFQLIATLTQLKMMTKQFIKNYCF